MQLRRFTADSTPEALGAVRQALGDDAIILANRKIGDHIEIIATGQMDDAQSMAEISLDTPPAHLARDTAAEMISDSRVGQPVRTVESASFDELAAAIDAVDVKVDPVIQASTRASIEAAQRAKDTTVGNTETISAANDLIRGKAAAHTPVSATSSVARTIHEDGNAALHAGLDKAALQTEIQNLTSGLDAAVNRHSEQLARTIEAQSTMINEHFKGLEVNLWGNNSPSRRLHMQRLFAMGIGAELAVQLAGRVRPDASVEDALRQSFALLKATLPIGADKTFSVPGVTIFAGPTGAGKTTTLMKVATAHVKEHGTDSVVIICADTRRIGAFEELQAYGRLLGVPTVHAHDSAELDSLLSAFTHKRLILIDHTLPLDEDAVEIPRRLLKPDKADSVRQLLVLSATSQSATIDSLISEHCAGRSMQCVLTHLDSNARLGELFNAIIRYHLPIAYWSDAASIQKPLQKADASVLVATAAAMSRRIRATPDDEWLLRLVQPSDELITPPVATRAAHEELA